MLSSVFLQRRFTVSVSALIPNGFVKHEVHRMDPLWALSCRGAALLCAGRSAAPEPGEPRWWVQALTKEQGTTSGRNYLATFPNLVIFFLALVQVAKLRGRAVPNRTVLCSDTPTLPGMAPRGRVGGCC